MEAMKRELGDGGLKDLGPALLGRVTRIARLLPGRQSVHGSDYSLTTLACQGLTPVGVVTSCTIPQLVVRIRSMTGLGRTIDPR